MRCHLIKSFNSILFCNTFLSDNSKTVSEGKQSSEAYWLSAIMTLLAVCICAPDQHSSAPPACAPYYCTPYYCTAHCAIYWLNFGENVTHQRLHCIFFLTLFQNNKKYYVNVNVMAPDNLGLPEQKPCLAQQTWRDCSEDSYVSLLHCST